VVQKSSALYHVEDVESEWKFWNRSLVQKSPPPVTPDGRYFVVRGRLWRCSNPLLEEQQRAKLVADLMAARRAKQMAMRRGDVEGKEDGRRRVDAAKIALGERGPVWWTDGTADLNRHLVRTTPYAEWFASLSPTQTDDPD
jgi:hypothetical protein